MAEQIMWAVKDMDGVLRLADSIADSELGAWHRFGGRFYVDAMKWKDELTRIGYRCIRVRVTEVQDGA